MFVFMGWVTPPIEISLTLNQNRHVHFRKRFASLCSALLWAPWVTTGELPYGHPPHVHSTPSHSHCNTPLARWVATLVDRAGVQACVYLCGNLPLFCQTWNGQPHQLAAFTRHTIKLAQAEPTPRADLHRSANELVALELTRTAMHALATRTTPPYAFLPHTHERNT
jgi:hypothetical protein